ncbi:DASH complex subunit ask1 [Linnemannia zychae]|nr:DASH complex subunit ask1 [Linnemannia zychae]
MSSSSAQSLTTDDVLDEIERLDQNITRTMQEIDQSFSDCQIIVSSKILPQIDRYAESSREVWKHAQLWINFFEAALAPSSTGTVGRRAQAIRNARNRQQAALVASNAHTSLPSNSTTPEYNSSQHEELNNSTNRRRISAINLASSRLSPDFLDSSPLGSLPPTPTPLGSNRNRLHQGSPLVPPAKIQWSKDGQGNATPPRRSFNYNTGVDRGSTTPTITLKDRPMDLSSYTQPKTSAATTTTPTRSKNSSGFKELNVDEDHQDAITPPSTLQFSVPESKIATTPRSVLAKSRVNKIQMKDGLVIPQPIFVNDDDGPEDAAFVERYIGRGPDEPDIGGSKKRGRDGDFLDHEDDHSSEGRTWKSLTEQQRNKERLLKSPRKMASVQDFFAVPSTTTLSKNQGQDDRDEERPKSPSLRAGNQTKQSAEEEEEIDPLLAALRTPPEIRRGIQEYKVRNSLLPQRPSAPSWTLNTTSNSTSSFNPTITSTTNTSTTASSTSAVVSASLLPATTSNITPVPIAAETIPTAKSKPVVTPAPISTTSAANPPAKTSSENSIDALFRQSLNTGFEATSNRRQTMATPIDLSRGPQGHSIAFNSRGGGSRNSIGGSTYRSTLTSGPFTTPKPSGPMSGRFSMLGSALRKPLYPTSPSPASRAAASAIVAAANHPPKSTLSTPDQQQQQGSLSLNSPRRSNGLARPSMPAGMAAYTSGEGTTRIASTLIVSTTSILTEKQGQVTSNTLSFTPNKTGDFTEAFSTPFSRNPPPAPRLGYHSDTIMTQSSLGLNHDGFGGYASEDRTRMTMASESSSGLVGSGARDGMSSVGGRTSATSDSGPFTDTGPFTEEEGDVTGEGDDDDVTGNLMRSPCPPGRTFYGPTTDLKSVAQATTLNSSLASKPSTSTQQQQQQQAHRRF